MSLIGRTFVTLLNHLLKSSGWARERLAGFAGSEVCLRVAPIEVMFRIDESGMVCDAVPGEIPEVVISFPIAELPSMFADPSHRPMGAVSLEGNAKLAETLGFVFRNLQWDIEEDLARIFGDIPAHRMVQGIQSLKTVHDRAVESVGANFAEYFGEEQKLLVTRPALAALSQDVQTLRDDTALLEKRLGRIGLTG